MTDGVPFNSLSRFRRLNRDEVQSALADVLQLTPAVVQAALQNLPKDVADAAGFIAPGSINFDHAEVLSIGIEKLAATVDLKKIAPGWSARCGSDNTVNPDCIGRFVTETARRAYRRPIDSAEKDALVAFVTTTAKALGTGKIIDSLRVALEVIVQSPAFLYLGGTQGPTPPQVQGQGIAMSDHERAARLSFLLVGAPPDAELAAAADAGALNRGSGFATQVDRLLSDPRSDVVFSRFFSQWMGLASLPDLERKPARDGTLLSPALRSAMREEVLAFVQRVLHGADASLTELLTRQEVMVDASLARHYSLPPPTGTGFSPQIPATQPRSGLLTLGAFLVAASTHDAPSPTRYGVRVRDDFLCHRLPPPPPGVDADLPPLQASDSIRSRTDAHTTESSCAGCHRYLDPIGFAALSFDHLGRMSDRPESTEGMIVDFDGRGDVPFKDVQDLGRLLASSEAVHSCFARKWLHFATAREIEGNVRLPDALDRAFVSENPDDRGDLYALLRALANSDLLRFREASL